MVARVAFAAKVSVECPITIRLTLERVVLSGTLSAEVVLRWLPNHIVTNDILI